MLLICGYTEVSKTWAVEEKTASVYTRIYYIEKGDVVFESDTEKRTLKKNHIYCFPNKKAYKIQQDKRNLLKCIYVHIDIAPYIISKLVEIAPENAPAVYYLMLALKETCIRYNNEKMSKTQGAIADSILEELSDLKYLEVVDEKISESISYMIHHINEELSIKELSGISGYHPQYYIRLFKSCMGMTPHQYIIQYRMKMAWILLNSGIGVAETAERVGYKESKNFCRAFKAAYGILPHQVRFLHNTDSKI